MNLRQLLPFRRSSPAAKGLVDSRNKSLVNRVEAGGDEVVDVSDQYNKCLDPHGIIQSYRVLNRVKHIPASTWKSPVSTIEYPPHTESSQLVVEATLETGVVLAGNSEDDKVRAYAPGARHPSWTVPGHLSLLTYQQSVLGLGFGGGGEGKRECRLYSYRPSPNDPGDYPVENAMSFELEPWGGTTTARFTIPRDGEATVSLLHPVSDDDYVHHHGHQPAPPPRDYAASVTPEGHVVGLNLPYGTGNERVECIPQIPINMLIHTTPVWPTGGGVS